MIHDILLSCLNLDKRFNFEEYIVPETFRALYHPSEKEVLKNIMEIVKLFRKISQFTKRCEDLSNSVLISNTTKPENSNECLRPGLYIKALSDGICLVIEQYYKVISDLEEEYLKSPTQSLLFIYHKLLEFEPLAVHLCKIISGVQNQKLHGCAILNYLKQKSKHGDARICEAMKSILAVLNVVFLKQLASWLLHAQIFDFYDEFFIECVDNCHTSVTESEKGGSSKHTGIALIDGSSNAAFAEVWRYQINYDMMPSDLSSAWAEKVHFVGQTVLLFRLDKNKMNKLVGDTHEFQTLLWGEKEHIFFKKIHALLDHELSVMSCEDLIDEIKLHLTTRLTEIAVHQSDLMVQLKLIKDFFLIGRGELYLEFLRSACLINRAKVTDNNVRNLVKAFEIAAHTIGASEDLERFNMSIAKINIAHEEELDCLQHIRINCKIMWPLQLLFSPTVIDRYNDIFHFLLRIKMVHYKLQNLWSAQNLKAKSSALIDFQAMQARNILTHFVVKLMYYVQVDVVESQFATLCSTISNELDIQRIQRAHSIFQANVLSLCFLLSENEDVRRISLFQTIRSDTRNPIYTKIMKILQLAEEFLDFMKTAEEVNEENPYNQVNGKLMSLIQELLHLLFEMKQNNLPLSQLLLRLDFNHWFSSNCL